MHTDHLWFLRALTLDELLGWLFFLIFVMSNIEFTKFMLYMKKHLTIKLKFKDD